MKNNRDPWCDIPEYVLPLVIVSAVSMWIIAMGQGDVCFIWPF